MTSEAVAASVMVTTGVGSSQNCNIAKYLICAIFLGTHLTSLGCHCRVHWATYCPWLRTSFIPWFPPPSYLFVCPITHSFFHKTNIHWEPGSTLLRIQKRTGSPGLGLLGLCVSYRSNWFLLQQVRKVGKYVWGEPGVGAGREGQVGEAATL